MKKKLGVIGTTLAIAFVFNSTSAFADDKKVDVFIDNQQVVFDTAPFIEQGTTLVQFKPVFEKLGMEFTWNEKDRTVLAKKADLEIKLQIGNPIAYVNGKQVKLLQAPKIVNDTTFVPLRFLGESSTRDVSWDGRTQTVYIADTKQLIKHKIELGLKYLQNEDVEGYKSTIDNESPDYEQVSLLLNPQFAAYVIYYQLLDFEIVENDGKTSAVKVKQKMTKESGPDEFIDQIREVIYVLQKKDGEWRLLQSIISKIDYMKQDLLKEDKVELSEDDKTKVLEVIEKDRVFREKEDIDGWKTLREDNYPNLDQTVLMLKQSAAAIDFSFTKEDVKIIKGQGDIAKVKFNFIAKRIEGVELPYKAEKYEQVVTLKKSKDGKWLIQSEDVVSIEYIFN